MNKKYQPEQQKNQETPGPGPERYRWPLTASELGQAENQNEYKCCRRLSTGHAWR